MPKVNGLCVIGRSDFESGYGQHSYAALEIYSRLFDTFFIDSRKVYNHEKYLILPNGREVPIADPQTTYAGYFFCDIPWNDFNFQFDLNLPSDSFRVAHLAWDSDQFPQDWIRVLNEKFDLALFTSGHLVEVAKNSGLEIDSGYLPLALDLEGFIKNRFQNTSISKNKLTFGVLSSYHPRKNLPNLLEAFDLEFTSRDSVLLKIHSNLSFGNYYETLNLSNKLIYDSQKITLSHKNISNIEKIEFINSIDVFVNVSRGEGFSIGPREAIASGKPCVLSEVDAHNDLLRFPSVVAVESTSSLSAFYPEIGNLNFGKQQDVSVPSIRKALRFAFDNYADLKIAALSPEFLDAHTKNDFSKSLELYGKVFSENLFVQKVFFNNTKQNFFSSNSCGTQSRSDLSLKLGAKKMVVKLHDGGYFSIFNALMGHLVGNQWNLKYPLVVPDWRPSKLLEDLNGKSPTSFCYGDPSLGNLWNLLYKPLPGMTDLDLNSQDFLENNVEFPKMQHAQDREPWLTYLHAYKLYKAPWFKDFRLLYNRVYKENVDLLPEFRKDIDLHLDSFNSGTFRISAHIRHPSHAIEQPDGKLAGIEQYVKIVDEILRQKKVSKSSHEWELFLATDNEPTILAFNEIYGERVKFISNVSRTTVAEMKGFLAHSTEQKFREGHQIQHKLAENISDWSHLKAFEVIRDAELLANSNVFIHSVSNVATAVSYMNPSLKMIYCSP